MRYEIRTRNGYSTLVEMGKKDSVYDPKAHYRRVTPEYARSWVRDGGHHETGLYVDTRGRVRHAIDMEKV